MPSSPQTRQPISLLTVAKPLAYQAIRMTNLVAIAANSTAHLWWGGSVHAARWRD
jgi:hypothetical protein